MLNAGDALHIEEEDSTGVDDAGQALEKSDQEPQPSYIRNLNSAMLVLSLLHPEHQERFKLLRTPYMTLSGPRVFASLVGLISLMLFTIVIAFLEQKYGVK